MSRPSGAAARLLQPLSALLGKPLVLSPTAQDAGHDAVPLGAGLYVTSGEPFPSVQRLLLAEILEVARECDGQREQIRNLEERIAALIGDNRELAVRNELLAEAAARDALTGLYNRWFVMDKIEVEINRSARQGLPMALLMMDIDHFKDVNDTYGHTAGDHVLQIVARLLKESCRVYDVPGRYGGEEFCLLLPGTGPSSTPVVAERIRQRLESTAVDVSGASVVVTASIGIADIDNLDDGSISAAALIDRADRALYTAKNLGRNRVAIWDAGLSQARPLSPGH